jgi:hypothetical protein
MFRRGPATKNYDKFWMPDFPLIRKQKTPLGELNSAPR